MTYKKIDHAFIMAAGRGSRLMPLTKNIPKGLVKYNQTTLISNGINKLKKYLKNIHISVGYKGQILAKYLIEQNISSIIHTKNKGNAWWIFNSVFKYFDGPLFVLTCDNVTNINFKNIEKDYFKKKTPLCMLIATKPVKGLSGDYIFSKKNIVTKLSRNIKSRIYCTGIQIINPKKINSLIKPCDDFNILWKRIIKRKELVVSDVKPKKWFTVDNIQNYKDLIKKKV